MKCCKKWLKHIKWIKREESHYWEDSQSGGAIFEDLRDYAKFCPECGSELEPQECEHVFHDLSTKWIKCTKCGEYISEIAWWNNKPPKKIETKLTK